METGKVLCTLFSPHYSNLALSGELSITRLQLKYTDVPSNHHHDILTIEAVRKSPTVSSRRSGMSAYTSAAFERSVLKSGMWHVSMPHE